MPRAAAREPPPPPRSPNPHILFSVREVLCGSELHILCEVPVAERLARWTDAVFDPATLVNLVVVHHVGNSGVRRMLEQLPIETYDSVLILADQTRETNPLDSDAHNLATLLLIRDLRNERPVTRRALRFETTPVQWGVWWWGGRRSHQRMSRRPRHALI